ncbi:thyrotropin receptor-like [Conger conger]|uniref:thyrotropin receptor-like n=1 Tax=Conger conger TaxID=82655 RepID=UPI002A59D5DE|nr:thyrotropin receptor-like [Conger conger]
MLYFMPALLSVISPAYILGDSEPCPAICECSEWMTYTISCFDIDVMPTFPASTETLWLLETRLTAVPHDAFVNMVNISGIYIYGDVILKRLEKHSFYNLMKATHIEVRNTRSLAYIDSEAFKNLPNLKYLGIFNTGLSVFPDLTKINSDDMNFILEMADHPYITAIPANSFHGITKNVLTVMLYSNGFTEIKPYAFNGTKLKAAYLHRNELLTRIDEMGFAGMINGPLHLDVSHSHVTSLPTMGLESLQELMARNTWTLKKLPPVTTFQHLLKVDVTYPSHCCGFKDLKKNKLYIEYALCNLTTSRQYQKNWNEASDLKGLSQNYRESEVQHKDAIKEDYELQDFHSDLHYQNLVNNLGFEDTIQTMQEDSSQYFDSIYDYTMCEESIYITCSPVPDALNPCEDIMGYSFLRVSVWFISLLTILGNLFVLVILFTSHYKLSVSRFLMCNLAFADLCMGIYLIIIASVDLHTRSEYYNYAIDWQMSPGCSLAGFLTVFASELSVYTLTVITLERWYTITFALRLDCRLRLLHVSIVMLGGWILCSLLALLPLVGISSYQKVSICLPMDTNSTLAKVYIVSMLSLNIFAFMVICVCYVRIYCMMQNPQSSCRSDDAIIVKRMAILIFMDFLCMAPISFFVLSAVIYKPLITVSDSKILLVLFYPLNACANPFLYTIFTKAFHGDVIILLSKIGFCKQQAQCFRGQPVSANSICHPQQQGKNTKTVLIYLQDRPQLLVS